VVPLILSSGAGSHARILLGLAVFGGMTAASLIAIFIIPVSFYVVETLMHRGGGPHKPAPQGQGPSGDGAHERAPAPQPAPAFGRAQGGH